MESNIILAIVGFIAVALIAHVWQASSKREHADLAAREAGRSFSDGFKHGTDTTLKAIELGMKFKRCAFEPRLLVDTSTSPSDGPYEPGVEEVDESELVKCQGCGQLFHPEEINVMTSDGFGFHGCDALVSKTTGELR